MTASTLVMVMMTAFNLLLSNHGVGALCDAVCDYQAYCGSGGPTSSSESIYSDTDAQADSITDDLVIRVVNRTTKQQFTELVPSAVGRGLILVYSGDYLDTSAVRKTTASGFDSLTSKYGRKYASTTPQDVRDAVCDFVKEYQIDVTTPEKFLSRYTTMNEFFYRKLKPGSRPITNISEALASPADCRQLVFPTVQLATSLWIKGQSFTIAKLLNNDPRWTCEFANPSIVINRLAPQDYHRFHAPFDAVVGRIMTVCGEYWSVNPTAIQNEHISVFSDNKRAIVELLVPYPASVANPPMFNGSYAPMMKILFIAVGATNVASINLNFNTGDAVHKGDDFGYFAFGGSTVLLLFPEGAVTFDDDILNNSQAKLETFVRVGERIGVVNDYSFNPGTCGAFAAPIPPVVVCAACHSPPSFLLLVVATIACLLKGFMF